MPQGCNLGWILYGVTRQSPTTGASLPGVWCTRYHKCHRIASWSQQRYSKPRYKCYKQAWLKGASSGCKWRNSFSVELACENWKNNMGTFWLRIVYLLQGLLAVRAAAKCVFLYNISNAGVDKTLETGLTNYVHCNESMPYMEKLSIYGITC